MRRFYRGLLKILFITFFIVVSNEVINFSRERKEQNLFQSLSSFADLPFTSGHVCYRKNFSLANPVFSEKMLTHVSSKRRSVSRLMRDHKEFLEMADSIFLSKGVPSELVHLAVVESGVSITSVSPKGAAGIWQIMPSTGEALKLIVSKRKDERKDPLKSTEAVARHLSQLYERYGDWLTVVAAYNCGTGRVNKAIRGSSRNCCYWQIKDGLPQETRNYVEKFLATILIVSTLENTAGYSF